MPTTNRTSPVARILEVNNLSISFDHNSGSIPAVKNISFHLEKGEVLGIVGESGSGKTVTALSLLQLLARHASVQGESTFTGDSSPVDLYRLPAKEIARVRGKYLSMIFQEPMTSLNPVFRCGSQVNEALLAHNRITKSEAKRRTMELFEKVQLQNPERIYESFPHQLSGGQSQRVMIAMAICNKPSILIADEPTTALDVTVQSNILKLLRSLRDEMDMGMIYISHDLGVISEIADRVLVMYKGSIVEEGNTKDILQRPKHPYTKGLIACRPPLDKKLRILPTIKDFMKVVDGKITEINPGIDNQNNIIPPQELVSSQKNIYSKSPAIEIQNLNIHFPVRSGVFGRIKSQIKAVDNVSFNIYRGETLGIVGESGSGKTTLGRAMIGLASPLSGKINVDGCDLADMKLSELNKVRKKIQIVFQDPYSSLNPKIKIGDAVMEPLVVHDLHRTRRKDRVFELFDMVDLEKNLFDRYPQELSGGQRQRVCIARALATDPEFLICDEPVSALDVSLQAQVLNLLNRLKHDLGFTCIMISHDLSVVKFMSDRLIVMQEGRIVETGNAEEIYRSPSSSYTQKLIQSIPGLAGTSQKQ